MTKTPFGIIGRFSVLLIVLTGILLAVPPTLSADQLKGRAMVKDFDFAFRPATPPALDIPQLARWSWPSGTVP